MEAIGEQVGEAYGGKAYDAGSRLPRPAHLLAVPDAQPPEGGQPSQSEQPFGGGQPFRSEQPSQSEQPFEGDQPFQSGQPFLSEQPSRSEDPSGQAQGLQLSVAAATPDGLSQLGGQLAALALAAPDVLGSASYVEAAEFAARAEELARSVEYLQLLGAAAVDRTRTQAITHAAAAKTRANPSRDWATGWDTHGIETLNTAAQHRERDRHHLARPTLPSKPPGRDVPGR